MRCRARQGGGAIGGPFYSVLRTRLHGAFAQLSDTRLRCSCYLIDLLLLRLHATLDRAKTRTQSTNQSTDQSITAQIKAG